MANSFEAPLVLRQVSYAQWSMWEVVEPLVFLHDTHGRIEVTSGFKTDGATIPRVLWSLFPPLGRYAKAAVLHDYLLVCLKVGATSLTRREIDGVFLDACLACSTNPFRARLLHAAVRLWSLVKDPHS